MSSEDRYSPIIEGLMRSLLGGVQSFNPFLHLICSESNLEFRNLI